ncbi:MAG: glycosyltransferase [Candidatus Faecivicinus sp.]
MKFSILVVALNAGARLAVTLDSILSQTYSDWEVIIKDGGSTDGSLEHLPADERISVVREKDRGIYDAMNQAIMYAHGDHGIFLNCGDIFHDDRVLEHCAAEIVKVERASETIFYGDYFAANRNCLVRYPDFSDYLCFTMVLCHQATIYPVELLKERRFDLSYRIASDYAYYVYAYKHGTEIRHIPVVISDYEGGGVSERTENRRITLRERKRILKECFTRQEYQKNWRRAQLHGMGIKHFLVQQDWFYPIYRKMAEIYYRLKAK